MGLGPDITPELLKLLAEDGEPPPPGPDTPAPIKRGKEAYSLVYWTLRDLGTPRWIARLMAGGVGSAIVTGAVLASVLMWAVVHILGPAGGAVVQLIGQIRKEANPEISQIAATVLGELLGEDFSPDDLPSTAGVQGRRERAAVVGSKLHAVLRDEFAPGTELSPEQGRRAAEMFSGFLTNFAVGSALISIVGELFSLGQMEEFRELGVEVAQNLGLGRLHRLALRPLIQTLISTPLQWDLLQRYRPTRLKPPELLRAWFRGAIEEDQLKTELTQEGYSDERIQQLVTDARPMLSTGQVTSAFLRGDIDRDRLAAEFKARGFTDDQIEILIADTQVLLNETEIFRLQRYGVLSREAAGGLLTQRGWRAENVQLLQQAQALERVDTIMAETVSAALRDVLDGVMDRSEFTDLLSRLPLVDEERRSLQDLLGIKLLKPRKVITLARMQTAFIEGVVDLVELEEYLTRVGYSDTDRQILVIETLLKSGKTAEADARKKKRGK